MNSVGMLGGPAGPLPVKSFLVASFCWLHQVWINAGQPEPESAVFGKTSGNKPGNNPAGSGNSGQKPGGGYRLPGNKLKKSAAGKGETFRPGRDNPARGIYFPGAGVPAGAAEQACGKNFRKGPCPFSRRKGIKKMISPPGGMAFPAGEPEYRAYRNAGPAFDTPLHVFTISPRTGTPPVLLCPVRSTVEKKKRLDKGIEVAVQHGIDIAGLVPGAVILDQAVGLQHI